MVLSCEDVSLGYEGKPVVEHLNFRLEQGDYLCILGENGSGKSTLMKAILGLKSPMQGMLVRGEDLKANEIGYLPQQTVSGKVSRSLWYRTIHRQPHNMRTRCCM